MTISFKDIMQKFYDDEKLGIKKEDAPVNATGVAVAGTGDDSSTVVVKKKKKNPYDGRTREAKAFLKRMIERQSKLKEAVELDEFNKMTVTVNNPKQRKKVFDDLKKQKRLDVSMGPGKTIKVDGKGKALNLFAKDIMNFYDAEIRAEEIEEDAKMGKQSDDNLKSLMKKFRDMEKKDPKMPSTQFMIKRIGKEMKKRGLKEEQLDELRQPFVVIDTARNNQVISTSSDEMGAKSAVASAELPPLNVKDKKTLKIVKTRKKQMIGYPLKEEVISEKVEYVEYKFKNKNDAMKAKRYFDGIQLMSFDVNDDDVNNGILSVDAGSKDMTKYHKEVMQKFKPKVLEVENVNEELKGFKVDFGKGMKQGHAIYKDKKDAEEFAARRKKLGELPVKITPTTVKNANMFDDPKGPKRKTIPENQKIYFAPQGEKITPAQVTKMFGYKDKNQIKAVIKMVGMSGIKVQQGMQKRNPSGYDRMITKLGNDSSFLKNEFVIESQLNTEKAKEFHLFDNEKEAQAFAKKSGGKLVKGVNKSKGKFAVVIEEVKTSFIDDIKEKMLTYSSDLMLNESNLKIVQDIVKRKSAKNIKFKDGSLKVDMFTASALSQIYDKVNTDNKKKMEKMMNGTKDQFMKLAKFALSKVG